MLFVLVDLIIMLFFVIARLVSYKAFDYDNITNTFIQQVRDRNPGVNVIGFRILGGNQLSGFVGKYAK